MKKPVLMSLLASAFALSAVCHQAVAQPPEPAAPQLPDAVIVAHEYMPDAVVQNFVWDFNRDELSNSLRWIRGAIVAPGQNADLNEAAGNEVQTPLADMSKEVSRAKGTFVLSADFLKPGQVKVHGESATAIVHLSLQDHLFDTLTWTESLSFQRALMDADTVWQIVPGDPQTILTDAKAGYLLKLATYLAYPELMLGKMRAAQSQANIGQLAIGIYQFIQDNNAKFALKADTWKESLEPDVISERYFSSPLAKEGEVSYSFNQKLEGVEDGKIADSSKTVMLYEGKDGHLNFRHDGRAAVAFADYHTALVDAEEAKNLKWTP